MKLLDLFSGIGGFSLAARWAGLETIGFCEIDDFCSKVLKKHWPNVPNFGDITKMEFNQHVDIITGGFPCQPFSVAGNKKGESDDRYLWPHFLRIIKQSQPRWVIAENVPGIINLALERVCLDLENENYEIRTMLIPACAVGAPHKRERIWIVAHAHSKRFNCGRNFWEKRHLQNDQKRDVEALYEKWRQFQPGTWQAFNAQNWLNDTANSNGFTGCERIENRQTFSERSERTLNSSASRVDFPQFDWEKNKPPVPGVDDGLPDLMDRNKSLGNAIVPQVAYVILKNIMEIENLRKKNYAS